MNKLVPLAALLLALPLVACVVGEGGTPGDGTGGGGGSGGGGGGGSADHITSDKTWSGTVDVTTDTVVDAKVTLTIAAGTTVRLATGIGITVLGTVDVQGTKGSVVKLSSVKPTEHHNGFQVNSGGELKMTYAVQSGGGIETTGSAKVTVSDTLMSQAVHDYLVVNGGTVTVSYSAIGLEPGTDTTHCDMHFGGAGVTISITHSNISNTPFGLMLYGGTGVNLTYNNWFNNEADIDTSPGTMGDISYSWFAKGAPTAVPGATLIATNLSATRLPDAGPR